MSAICPIWKTQADVLKSSGGKTTYDSGRAGGIYTITASAEAGIVDRPPDWRSVSLTEEIYRANSVGTDFYIDSSLLNQIQHARKISVSEKADRTLRFIADFFPELGQTFRKQDVWRAAPLLFLAANQSACASNDGVVRQVADVMVSYLIERHFLSVTKDSDYLFISVSGWEALEKLSLDNRESRQIFGAMWFGSDEQSKIWHEAMAPAIDDAGYVPLRIDNKEHNGKIDDEIIAEIRRSRAVIVDMTCGLCNPIDWSLDQVIGAPRGGVYYEAGFAAGLGLPVIWTVKQEIAEVPNVVHFDIRQYSQIRWSSDDIPGFRKAIKNRIEATLGRGDGSPKN